MLREKYSVPSVLEYNLLPKSLRGKKFMYLQTPNDVDKTSEDYGRFVYAVGENNKIYEECETDLPSEYITISMHPDFKSEKYDWDKKAVFILADEDNKVVYDEEGREVCFYVDGIHLKGPQKGQPIVHYVLGFNKDNLNCDVVITEPIAYDNHFNGPNAAIRQFLRVHGQTDIVGEMELNNFEISELNAIVRGVAPNLKFSVPVLTVDHGLYENSYLEKYIYPSINPDDYDMDRLFDEGENVDLNNKFDKDFAEEFNKVQPLGDLDERSLGFGQAPYTAFSKAGEKFMEENNHEMTAEEYTLKLEKEVARLERKHKMATLHVYARVKELELAEQDIAEVYEKLTKMQHKHGVANRMVSGLIRKVRENSNTIIGHQVLLAHLLSKEDNKSEINDKDIKNYLNKQDIEQERQEKQAIIDMTVEQAATIKKLQTDIAIYQDIEEDYEEKVLKLENKNKVASKMIAGLLKDKKRLAAGEGMEAVERLYELEQETAELKLRNEALESSVLDLNSEVKAKTDRIIELEDKIEVMEYQSEDRFAEFDNQNHPNLK